MKLNCKPKDLALVVSGEKSAGRVVKCIRLVQFGDTVFSKCGMKVRLMPTSNVAAWHIEGHTFQDVGWDLVLELPVAQDYGLRPLRPGEGEDETLTWAGKPEGVAA